MRFWDSSAVIPLIFREPASESLDGLLAEDGDMVVWWGTWAECAVIISRLRRDGELDGEEEEETRMALADLASDWREIEPADDMRLLASLLAKDYPLKAADSLQLAAALRWSEGDTEDRSFVCLDRTLGRAAAGEGFDVSPEKA